MFSLGSRSMSQPCKVSSAATASAIAQAQHYLNPYAAAASGAFGPNSTSQSTQNPYCYGILNIFKHKNILKTSFLANLV